MTLQDYSNQSRFNKSPQNERKTYLLNVEFQYILKSNVHSLPGNIREINFVCTFIHMICTDLEVFI